MLLLLLLLAELQQLPKMSFLSSYKIAGSLPDRLAAAIGEIVQLLRVMERQIEREQESACGATLRLHLHSFSALHPACFTG